MRAAALALIPAAALLGACARQPAAESEPVQTMHELTLNRSEDGQPNWDLFSITARLLENDQKALLDLPRMSFYQDGKVATHVTALSGLVHTDTQDVVFSTNVVVHSLDDGSTLYTSLMNYSSSRKKFFTDKPVVVVRSDGVVHGVGMEANGDLSEIHIFHQHSVSQSKGADFMILALLLLSLLAPARAAGPVAGTFVTSDEWTVHREPKGKEEEFSGHVHYHAGPTKIDADWALYQHAIKRWHAKGHVFVRQEEQSGDVFIARGDDATLMEETKSGEMTAKNRVSFERQTVSSGTDFGEADQATWEGKERATLTGRVLTWGPRLASWSDRADYSAGKIVLTGGRPVVRKFDLPDSHWRGVVKGDVVTAAQSEHRLDADGHALGWLIFPASQESAKAKKKKKRGAKGAPKS